MKQSQRRPSIFFNLILFAGLVVIWVAFAPTKIGGQASYVMVNGISMEPNYHTGDLVIVHKVQTYQVGDVVTYRDAFLGAYIIHRIIAIEQDNYVFKGDNNSWIDTYKPTRDELVGKLWIYVPKLGKAMEWLRLPINMSLTIALLGGILMAGIMIKPKERGKGKSNSSGNFGGMLEGGLYLFGFFWLIFLGLGIFAFTRPLMRPAEQIQYQQESQFSYSATGTPGIYDTEVVRSGEPVFPKLTCFINIGLMYSVLGNQLQGTSGSYQLVARVMDEQSGWQRTIPMKQSTAFSGNSFSSLSALDLCQVESLVETLKQETGLRASTYTLEIITQVGMTANAAGNQISDSFEPRLVFRFDEVHFYLSTPKGQEDPLHLSKQSLAANSSLEANTLSLLGWKPAVGTVRTIALLGLGLSLSGLLVVGLYLYNTAQSNPQALIQLKYAPLLMDVHERVMDPLSPAIDVRRIEDLAKIAERQNTVILHMTLDLMDTYLVQSNGLTYRYVASNNSSAVVEVARPVHQEILQYMLRNDVKTVIDSKPTQEVIYQDARPANRSKTPNAEPPEKVVMRYSMNVSRTHSKS